MEILVKRTDLNPKQTIGEMYINGVKECYTLEDKVREVKGEKVVKWKIKSQTAIPAGTYEVKITFSPKYQRMMPILVNVEGFEGVRIHSGNSEEDTEGCILVGTMKLPATIGNSRAAAANLYKKLQAAVDKGEKISLTIG